MKIGICTSIDNIDNVIELGFDYIEPSVTSIARLSDSTFKDKLDNIIQLPIDCEVFNCLFPSNIPLYESIPNQMIEYLNKAFDRCSKLGAKVIIFGSGGARRKPEGTSKEEAWDQLIKTTKVIGEVAKKYQLTIAIEPLNSNETDTINSVEEGYKFIKEVNHPHIQLLADFYHMKQENEPLENVLKVNESLKHIHISNGNTRAYPLIEDEDDYVLLFSLLEEINYNARVSIEGKTDNFEEDALTGLNLLRKLSR